MGSILHSHVRAYTAVLALMNRRSYHEKMLCVECAGGFDQGVFSGNSGSALGALS